MSEDLKLCPFCGTAEIKIYDTTENWESSALTVTCSKCTASIRVIAKCDTDDKARAAWNRRATPAPKKTDEELVEAMAKASFEHINHPMTWDRCVFKDSIVVGMRAALNVVRGAS